MGFNFFRKKKEKTLKKENVKVCESMRDFSREDFFVKKVEVAKEVLTKWGVPNDLIIK